MKFIINIIIFSAIGFSILYGYAYVTENKSLLENMRALIHEIYVQSQITYELIRMRIENITG